MEWEGGRLKVGRLGVKYSVSRFLPFKVLPEIVLDGWGEGLG
jgi:hypothetical protein